MILSELIESELLFWREQESSADAKNKYVVHGGVCEILWLKDNIEKITREFLLARYNEIRDSKSDAVLYELALVSAERNKKRMEAIKIVGTKLKMVC
jgi:hypothetical protein